MRRVTIEKKEAIVNALLQKVSGPKIAKTYGTSLATVYKLKKTLKKKTNGTVVKTSFEQRIFTLETELEEIKTSLITTMKTIQDMQTRVFGVTNATA